MSCECEWAYNIVRRKISQLRRARIVAEPRLTSSPASTAKPACSTKMLACGVGRPDCQTRKDVAPEHEHLRLDSYCWVIASFDGHLTEKGFLFLDYVEARSKDGKFGRS